MASIAGILSEQEHSRITEITELVDQGEYVLAMDLIYRTLPQCRDLSEPRDAILKVALAGLLIDIGSEGRIKKAAADGLKILEAERSLLGCHIEEGGYEYNLGNAKSALFAIERSEKDFKFKPEAVGGLVEAKNHYWKAYKLLSANHADVRRQLLVNLGNTMSTSGRVAEALQYYDLALREDPSLPQANMARAQCLLWLNNLSDTYSINLLNQAMHGFAVAAQSDKLPNAQRKECERRKTSLQNELGKRGYTETDLNHLTSESQSESSVHSIYRRFCIENHLCLSEHSLYCNCLGARRDDLSIPKTTASIGGAFVPRMELLLNRLKSEFSLARLLYYQSAVSGNGEWHTYDSEVTFTELFESEFIGPRPEMLRASFRMCFGILDKIAFGICSLFDLAESDEPIYFESFWKPRGKSLSSKQAKRWSTINSVDNFPLLALYSQATDLNSTIGEWRVFKAWRNALEHRALVLTRASATSLDPFSVLDASAGILLVNAEEFKERALHMMQITRSAIINFVFCVRVQGSKGSRDSGRTITFGRKDS